MTSGERKTERNYHTLAAERGIIWLGPLPKATRFKTWWECEKGHKREVPYDSIRKGYTCLDCSAYRKKVEQDYYTLAAKRGIVWLGPLPPSTKIKTWWECGQGHKCLIRYNDIQQGHICPVCGIKRRGDWQRKEPADYHALAKERGYKWLGPFPDTIKGKTRWKCGKGHQWQAKYNTIQQGCGCPKCGKVSMAEKRRHSPTDYHTLAQQRGYKWLGLESFRALDKTWWECKQGHRWETSYNSIQQGNGCPACRNIAIGERTKRQWAAGLYDNAFKPPYKTTEIPLMAALDICGIEHVSQYRPGGCRFVFDEFIPPNLLVEAHGDYWHSLEKAQKRDAEKATWAEENGFVLVVVWECELKEQGAWSLVHERVLPLLPGGLIR